MKKIFLNRISILQFMAGFLNSHMLKLSGSYIFFLLKVASYIFCNIESYMFFVTVFTARMFL